MGRGTNGRLGWLGKFVMELTLVRVQAGGIWKQAFLPPLLVPI